MKPLLNETMNLPPLGATRRCRSLLRPFAYLAGSTCKSPFNSPHTIQYKITMKTQLRILPSQLPVLAGLAQLESTNYVPALPAASWSLVPGAPVIIDCRSYVTNFLTASNNFYRLRKP